MPENFNKWASLNQDRIARAEQRGTLPYFVRDNRERVKQAVKQGDVMMGKEGRMRYGSVKLGKTATKEAYQIYKDRPSPTLTPKVRENAKDIASLFGIDITPMTFLDANQGRANIDWGKNISFRENCQTAVAVHEARIRGINITSLGYNSSKNSVSYRLGERFQDIWIHPKTNKIPSPTIYQDKSFESMLKKMEDATIENGRYHIGINWNNGGHLLTAQKINGKMYYYDPQIGEFINIKEYGERGVEYFELLKVDKLLFNKDLLKEISRLL